MKTKTIYACEYCNNDYNDKEICIEHENNCNKNPKFKSCDSCDHVNYKKYMASGRWHCNKLKFFIDFQGRTNTKKDCKYWKI